MRCDVTRRCDVTTWCPRPLSRKLGSPNVTSLRCGKRCDVTRRCVVRCDEIRCDTTCDKRCDVTNQRCDVTEIQCDVRYDRDTLCCETRHSRVALRWDAMSAALNPCGQDEMRYDVWYLARLWSRCAEIRCLLPCSYSVHMRWDTLSTPLIGSREYIPHWIKLIQCGPDEMICAAFYLAPMYSRWDVMTYRLPWSHVVTMRCDTLSTTLLLCSQDVMTYTDCYFDPVWPRCDDLYQTETLRHSLSVLCVYSITVKWLRTTESE